MTYLTHVSRVAVDIVRAEQEEMKTVVEEYDDSQEDEKKQASAHKALMELKKIRNKQRTY